jgi:hypothetical protein
MDGQLLTQSLFALKGDDLRIVFALICRTNIGNIVSSKTMDLLLADEQNHLQKHLLNVVKSLKDISDGKLQFNLFLEMTKVAGIKGVRYGNEEQIEQQASKIIDETYKFLEKREKDFINGKANNDLTKLQNILVYQIDKLLPKLPKMYVDFNKEDKQDFAMKLVHYCNALSVEQQERLKTEWAVESINSDIIEMIINHYGLETVLTILKRAGGFAFYIQFAPVLFTNLGLNLPMDRKVNGKGMIDSSNTSALIEINSFIWSMQHNDLQKSLLPIVIMLMVCLYLSTDQEQNLDCSMFINEWKVRFYKYVSLKKGQREIESRQNDVRDNINAKIEILQQVETNISKCVKTIENERESILSNLKTTELHALEISRKFQQYVQEFYLRKAKIEEIKTNVFAQTDEGNILKKLGLSFAKIYREYNVNEEEKKLDSLYHLMIDEVINSSATYSFCMEERKRVTFLTRLLKQLNEQKGTEEQNKKDLENNLNSISQEVSTISQSILDYEKENYGLNHLTLLSEDFLEMEQGVQEEITKQSKQNDIYWKKKQLFIHNYENQISRLEQQYKQSLTDLETEQTKLNLLEQQSKRMEKEIEELTTYKVIVEELEQKNQDLINQSKKIIEENVSQTKRLLQEKNSDWVNRYNELKEAAEIQNKQLHNQIQEWSAKYQKLESDFLERHQSFQRERSQYHREIDQLKDSVTTLRQQLKDHKANDSIVEKQTIKLMNELDSVKDILEKTTKEKNQLINLYQSKIDEQKMLYTQQINELKVESQSKLQQLTAANQQKQENEMKKLKQNWQKKQEVLVQNYEGKLAEKNSLIDQLQWQRQQTEEKSYHLMKSVEETNQKQLEELQSENEKLRKEKIQVEEEWAKELYEVKAQFEAQLDELTKELDGKKKSNDPLVEEIKVLETVPFSDLF